MAEEVHRAACLCCKPACMERPTEELDPCGHVLSKAEFDPSVQPDIPDAAETMRWLTRTRPLIMEGSSESSDVDQIYYQDTFSGVDVEDSYDPDAGCSLSTTITGSATSRSVDDSGAVFSVSGPAVMDGDTPIIVFTGTDFLGNPITYNEDIPAEFPGIDPAEATPVYSVAIVGPWVVQTRERTWAYTDETDVPERNYFGNDVQEFGYLDPFFRNKITAASHPDVKYQEIEWVMQIAPPAPAEPYDISIRRYTWRDGDATNEWQQVEDYSELGEISMRGMRWRCTPVGHWQADPLDFVIGAWPEDDSLAYDGIELNMNGLYLMIP